VAAFDLPDFNAKSEEVVVAHLAAMKAKKDEGMMKAMQAMKAKSDEEAAACLAMMKAKKDEEAVAMMKAMQAMKAEKDEEVSRRYHAITKEQQRSLELHKTLVSLYGRMNQPCGWPPSDDSGLYD